MNDNFFDLLNGTVGVGEYLLPKELLDAGFYAPNDDSNQLIGDNKTRKSGSIGATTTRTPLTLMK